MCCVRSSAHDFRGCAPGRSGIASGSRQLQTLYNQTSQRDGQSRRGESAGIIERFAASQRAGFIAAFFPALAVDMEAEYLRAKAIQQ